MNSEGKKVIDPLKVATLKVKLCDDPLKTVAIYCKYTIKVMVCLLINSQHIT